MPPKHTRSTKITVSLRLVPGRAYQLYYRDIASGEKIRRTTGTFDPVEAERLREQLEAQLRLGLFPTTRPALFGPDMLIEEFCSQYDRLHCQADNLRESSRKAAMCRLRLVATAGGAITLGQLASRDKRELAQGVLRGQGLSDHTVKGYMITVNAALKWAERRDWLTAVPHVKLPKTSHLKGAKGRPITTEEFERLLAQLEKIVGPPHAAAYQLPARILLAQGLRLEEAWMLHWFDDQYIVPRFHRSRRPTLYIPAQFQKNDTEQELPMTPWLEQLLAAIPEEQRTGWICQPQGLRMPQRITAERYGKLLSRAGEAALIVVNRQPQKFASAHDLRRTFAERLIDLGLDGPDVMELMRHASLTTTLKFYVGKNVQRTSDRLFAAAAPAECVPHTPFPTST